MITIAPPKNVENPKSRNIFLTISILIFMLADLYILKVTFDNNITNDIYDLSETINYVYVVLTIIDILFIVYLIKWKKWAFWGIVATSITTFMINIFLGVGLYSMYGLFGVIVLFGLLQLKSRKISGWKNLE